MRANIIITYGDDVDLELNIKSLQSLIDKTVKQGGHITMGVDNKSVMDIMMNEHFIPILYIINKKQFEEIKKR